MRKYTQGQLYQVFFASYFECRNVFIIVGGLKRTEGKNSKTRGTEWRTHMIKSDEQVPK